MKPENSIEVLHPGSRAIERRKPEALLPAAAESPDFVAYGIVLRKRRWTVVTLAAVIFAAVLLVTLKETPLYEAKALLEIEKENPNIVTAADLFEIDNVSNTFLETQYKVLESDSISRRVIHDLALDDRAEFNPPRHWWSLRSRPAAAQASLAPGAPEPDSDGVYNALKTYQDRLDIDPVKQSRLVEVSFSSRDPVLAAEIVNSVADNYINHNHFANLLELILPLALSLALYYAQKARIHSRPRSRGEFFGDLGRPELLKCFLLLLAATVLFVAIFFSFSRMGMISMLASLALLAAAVFFGRARNPQPIGFVVALVVCGIATAAWLGAAPVVEHFESLAHGNPLERGAEGRRALWSDALKLVRAHPLAGSGLGCFEIAFTAVQSAELDYTIDHAHNDYLEFAVELGVPAAALLFTGVFWIAARAFQAGYLARSGLSRAHALGAACGVAALLVHSLADFNLQIPANALVCSALLGLGAAVSLEARAESAMTLRHRATAQGAPPRAAHVPSQAIGARSGQVVEGERTAEAPEEIEVPVSGRRSS